MIPHIKNGIINIDKPQGITSHDVVSIIRKLFPRILVFVIIILKEYMVLTELANLGL